MSILDVVEGRQKWWVEQGDGRDLARLLPAGAVDAVVTDPPYGMDWDSNSNRYSGGNCALRRSEGRDDWPAIHADDQPFDPVPWLAFPRVILWGANHFAARLPVGTTLVWIKRANHLFGSFLSDAEVGWMRGGHGVYCYQEQFPPPRRMLEGGGEVLHPNQKPVELMTWCLERAKVPPGGLVLDPYMGSATTGVACLRRGLRFIGVEIVPAYFTVAKARLDRASEDGPLFDSLPAPQPASTLFDQEDT